MTYKLGRKSLRELHGVHPDLSRVVKRAIEITDVDFAVHDGARTLAEQKRLVAIGASTTMNSKHLIQSDGYGYAVDLVPYINGKMRWEWEPIYLIALAMNMAAKELVVKPLYWGGNWYTPITDYGTSVSQMRKAVKDYKKQHQGSDFIDGPHFHLPFDYKAASPVIKPVTGGRVPFWVKWLARLKR